MSQTDPSSYWAATAEAASPTPALEHDTEADVVIVGAGFTGLSAAYRLAMGGRSCVVLDANDVAWGASGRNGGMVVPRFKHTYPALAARYGVPAALGMYRLAHRAVDLIEQVVRDERIDCGFSRCGHITPVVRAHDASRFDADARWLEREAQDRAPCMLGRPDTERRSARAFMSMATSSRAAAASTRCASAVDWPPRCCATAGEYSHEPPLAHGAATVLAS